jgi:hypothetical protein
VSYEPPPAPPPPPGWGQQPGYQPPPAPPGYPGYPGYPSGNQGYVPNHPQATTALVLGILGVALCGLLAPAAFVLGRRAIREIDASGGALGGRGSAQAGWILGLVGTIVVVASVLLVAVAIVAAIVSSDSPSLGLAGG